MTISREDSFRISENVANSSVFPPLSEPNKDPLEQSKAQTSIGILATPWPEVETVQTHSWNSILKVAKTSGYATTEQNDHLHVYTSSLELIFDERGLLVQRTEMTEKSRISITYGHTPTDREGVFDVHELRKTEDFQVSNQ